MDVVNVQVIKKERHLILNGSTFSTKNGSLKVWHWAERPGNVSAVMVAALCNDNLVLIREFRVPINDYVWGLPAGLVESHESPEKTAEREMFEETGLTIKKVIRPISHFTRTSPGLTNEHIYYYFVEVEGTPSNSHLEETEDIEVFLCDRHDVAEILRDNKEVDSKAYLIMQRFAEDGKI